LRVTTQQNTDGGNTPTYDGNSAAESTANGTQQLPLMDLLNVPVLKTSRTKTMNTGKVHALTSAECLKVLQEKESEKRKGLKKKKTAKARETDEKTTEGRATEAYVRAEGTKGST